MKANFEINLPSIPGKNIKFKIQDIKSAAFGVQKARFPDNKALLTKKFIQSFHNFHESKKDDEVETQAESQLGRSQIEKKQAHFRSIVSQNKKFLLPLYATKKKEEKQKIQKSLQSKVKGGFSFAKSEINTRELNRDQALEDGEDNNYNLTDNYYFNNEEQISIEKEGKRQRPSAVFKAETRKRVYDRLQYSIVPGPGAYIKDKVQKKKIQVKKQADKSQNSIITDEKHLKEVIEKVLDEDKQQIDLQVSQQFQNKQLKVDHMFVLDDRDRFGDQVFPIAPKVKIPGPGSYQVSGTIQSKAKKLLLVEEQRKLLKQWFNN